MDPGLDVESLQGNTQVFFLGLDLGAAAKCKTLGVGNGSLPYCSDPTSGSPSMFCPNASKELFAVGARLEEVKPPFHRN